MKIGRGGRQCSCLSPILFSLNSKYLTKEALEGFGDFKRGEHVICTVKYKDDHVLPDKEETMLQGMFDRLIEIGGCYGMQMNMEKSKAIEWN